MAATKPVIEELARRVACPGIEAFPPFADCAADVLGDNDRRRATAFDHFGRLPFFVNADSAGRRRAASDLGTCLGQ